DPILNALFYIGLQDEKQMVVVPRIDMILIRAGRYREGEGLDKRARVCDTLSAMIMDLEGELSLTVAITHRVRRSLFDEGQVIIHGYELTGSEEQLSVYSHGISVEPQLPEQIDASITYAEDIIAAGEGAKKIRQDLGENQELRAAECDY